MREHFGDAGEMARAEGTVRRDSREHFVEGNKMIRAACREVMASSFTEDHIGEAADMVFYVLLRTTRHQVSVEAGARNETFENSRSSVAEAEARCALDMWV